VFCAGFGVRCIHVDKVLSTYCKIQYVLKFTVASRGSAYASTASLFYFGTKLYALVTEACVCEQLAESGNIHTSFYIRTLSSCHGEIKIGRLVMCKWVTKRL